MIPWTGAERRARDALLRAMIPGGHGCPPLASLDLRSFWQVFGEVAPPFLRFGLRASVWILTIVAPWLIGRVRPFLFLNAADRDRAITAASRSRSYLVRQCALTLKTIACLAYFRDPDVRARFPFELPARPREEPR
jgi:hypothetical protein